MQTNKTIKTKNWRRHKIEEKIQDISEEKGAPKTTKQTVTGQKTQEKSLNGTYTDTGYKEETL